LTANSGRNYSVVRSGHTFVFRTASFSDGTTSVLHSGIYNREFASALASFAVGGVAYMVLAWNSEKTVLASAAFIVVFAAGFPLFRRFVFKEKYAEAVFDAAKGEAEIFLIGMTRRKKENIPLAEITQVVIESRKKAIENPDGAEFVEKISLQHGMSIPGFGEETVLFLLKLKLRDGSDRTIYADTNMQDVISAHEEIKNFMENNNGER
jgi:hypothetical protein